MQISSRTDGGVTVARVEADRLDAAAAIEFKDRMLDIARAADGRIVLDLERVEFIDSSGLGALVAATKLLGDGQALELAGLTPLVQKVFHLTRMDTIFTIHDTAGAALAARDR